MFPVIQNCLRCSILRSRFSLLPFFSPALFTLRFEKFVHFLYLEFFCPSRKEGDCRGLVFKLNTVAESLKGERHTAASSLWGRVVIFLNEASRVTEVCTNRRRVWCRFCGEDGRRRTGPVWNGRDYNYANIFL